MVSTFPNFLGSIVCKVSEILGKTRENSNLFVCVFVCLCVCLCVTLLLCPQFLNGSIVCAEILGAYRGWSNVLPVYFRFSKFDKKFSPLFILTHFHTHFFTLSVLMHGDYRPAVVLCTTIRYALARM